jgi:cardiolipin synthase
VVDGRVAITGGVNVSMAQWLEEPVGNEVEASKGVPWRDTNVQIEGPAVAQVQRLFVDNWRQYAGCEPVNGDYFPQPKEEGDTLVRIAANSPGKCNRLTFLMYVSAISSARKSVHLTAGYFIPDEQVICALSEAARRGVDVKIVVAAASDSSLMLNAVRANYSRLMKAGVKFYERRDVALHAKTAVIDGVWVTVGSTNMDYWSFLNNDEINAEMLDGEFAAKMEAMFADDIGQSDEVRAEEWEKRSWGRRFNEWYSHLFAYWL